MRFWAYGSLGYMGMRRGGFAGCFAWLDDLVKPDIDEFLMIRHRKIGIEILDFRNWNRSGDE